VTEALREKMVSWVTNHENVIHSPIANDTLLIKSTVAGVTQKMRVGKLLCEFLVRELHKSMVGPVEEGGLEDARNSEGKVVVSNLTLCSIMTEDLLELRCSTERYKQMCGRKTCLTITAHQKSLNAWRSRQLRCQDILVEEHPEDQEYICR
jgi:hypothetical protein